MAKNISPPLPRTNRHAAHLNISALARRCGMARSAAVLLISNRSPLALEPVN
jgi:hypothetical protein